MVQQFYILLLGIYPKKFKSESQRDICTPVFIEALFTTAKMWEKPNGSSVDE